MVISIPPRDDSQAVPRHTNTRSHLLNAQFNHRIVHFSNAQFNYQIVRFKRTVRPSNRALAKRTIQPSNRAFASDRMQLVSGKGEHKLEARGCIA